MSRRLVLLILFAIVASLLLFMPLPASNTYAARAIENAGHTPLFLVGTLFILSMLRHDRHMDGARMYALAGLIGAAAGLLSEAIQKPLKRDASWEDAIADCVGALLALALFALFDRWRRLGMPARALLVLLVAGCLVQYVEPVVSMVRAYLYRDESFPVLASFYSPMEFSWIVTFGVNREIRDDALDVSFEAELYPGISFYEPVPDWTHYRTLVLDVENPDAEELHFGIRVHDIGHGRDFSDRFNRHLTLAGGVRQQFRIPLEEIRQAPRNRLMNMAQISDVTLFRTHGPGSKHMRLYNMQLE